MAASAATAKTNTVTNDAIAKAASTVTLPRSDPINCSCSTPW
jgi:hypothetical protein